MSKITPPPAMTDEQVESLWNWADEKADWHPCVDFAQAIQSARDQQWQDMLAQQVPAAWRYTDARGHYRYRGFVANFDKDYPLLKPQPLYASPVAQQAVPAGCKVVPVEPTPEMQAPSYMGPHGPSWSTRKEIYRAMLAAAPEQPAPAAIHPSDLKWLQKQPERDEGSHIVYDTEDIDDLTCRLTGDEGEDDSVTVLQRLAFAVENRRPGKTVYDLLDELDAADETKKARQPAQQPLTDEQALSCIPQIRKPGTDTMVPMVWMQQRDAIQAIRSAERAHGITKGDAS